MNTRTFSSPCIALAVLCLLVSLPSNAADATKPPGGATGDYKSAAGPFAVETVEPAVLHDEARKKDLPVFVSFPKGDGPFPIIVFSHGAGGSGDMGLPIVQHWASHGYAVLCPTHDDSIKLRRARGEATGTGLRELLGDSIGKDEANLNRPKDVTFLLDSLGELEKKVPALKGKLDRSRIGVGGHSFGAYTAQVAGGATVKLGGTNHTLADPRLKAVLQLSGQGQDQQGLHKHSWDAMKLPMMCVTGSADRGSQGQEPLWRRDPFALSPAGGKYFVFIEGAHHGSFTGKQAEGGAGSAGERFKNMTPEQREKMRERFKSKTGEAGKKTAENLNDDERAGKKSASGAALGSNQKLIFDWVKQATTAFWDAHLQGDPAAVAWLKSDALVTAAGEKLKLERR